MVMILEREVGADGMDAADALLVLPFDTRSRSRFRARLDNGEEVGVILTRGHILRGGDRLRADDGRVIRVEAACESVSTAHARDAAMLARGAYHLGNRHVALQIGPSWLRYGHDHVLDDMVRGLGLTLVIEEAPFEPEAGAYHSHGGHESPRAHDDLTDHHDHGDDHPHEH